MAGVYENYIGKPLQVISSLGVRYTGIFDSIDMEEQTLCFHSVYNWGTEDRPAKRFMPANPTSIGWVRFKTSGIASLSAVENYVEPAQEQNDFEDPTLVSVSQQRPQGLSAPDSQSPYPPQQQPYQQQQQPRYGEASGSSYGRPGAPHRQSSAHTAMDRVQQSLADLSSQPRGSGPSQEPVQDFDFAQNERFAEQEREEKRRRDSESQTQTGVEGENGQNGEASRSPVPQQPKAPMYQKSSFFDGLSSQTGRINKNEERHRNLDTFGEAGNNMHGHFNNRGGRGGRGGYNRGGGGGGGGRGRGNGAWRGGNGMPQSAT